MRSTKSGPGRCSRSFAIFGDLNPSRDSAFAPRYVSIFPGIALVAISVSLLILEFLLKAFHRQLHPPALTACHALDRSIAPAIAPVRTVLPIRPSAPAPYPRQQP